MPDIYDNLSEFVNRTFVAINQSEEAIIVINVEGGRPVSLIGFIANPELSDFEIQEQGYEYFLKLQEVVNNIKQK